jgi:luciferase family oxidoreductase group 1
MSHSQGAITLSVLDQAPTRTGVTPAQSIREVADLARHVEALGYRRFWIAEHHAIGAVASTAPEVLIGHVAAATSTIRVGSGGMLLPNHRPLHVAELFRMLAALHPGRIDLGVGRAEGALNPAIVKALGRPENSTHAAGYEQMLDELLSFAGVHPLPPDHELASVRAAPLGEDFPPIFMLGSSTSSAQTAAAKGLGYGFAAYTGPDALVPALQEYRAQFTPGSHAEPYAIIGLKVMVGENDEHAQALNAPSVLAMAQARAGTPQPLVDVETALAHRWSDAEREAAAKSDARVDVIGGPESVAARISELVDETGADEVIATSSTFDPADRRTSYTRLAAVFELTGASPSRPVHLRESAGQGRLTRSDNASPPPIRIIGTTGSR